MPKSLPNPPGTSSTLGSDVLTFQREDGVAENFHTGQNRHLLEQLASQTGGRYWKPSDLKNLPRDISYSEAGISVRNTEELWNMPIVFLLLLAFPRRSGCCAASGVSYEDALLAVALSRRLAAHAHAATYYVVVAGLGGEPDYEQRFTAAANDLDKVFKAQGPCVACLHA